MKITEIQFKNSCSQLELNPYLEQDEDSIIGAFYRSKQNKEDITAKIMLFIFLDQERKRNGTPLRIPIQNPCYTCGGRGYLPTREIIMSESNCPYCHGTGIKTVPCKKCEGTGFQGNKYCTTCNGSGVYRLFNTKNNSCSYCRGTGKKETPTQGPNIIDIDICKKCRGLGSRQKQLNPVFKNSDIINKISEFFDQQKFKHDPEDFEYEVRKSFGMNL